MMQSTVIAVCRDEAHVMSKPARDAIVLVAGLGVAGDAHAGEKVQHRSHARRDPLKPNLRQVHLMHAELHDELQGAGFDPIAPGAMGENITTRGLDLLALPVGTLLMLGSDGAIVELTGLRNPCVQLDGIQPGLMAATLDRTPDGELVRKSGVMGIVVAGGEVRRGDPIAVALPEGKRRPLEKV